MPFARVRAARAFFVACLLLYTGTAFASITQIFVFGDSLSDGGNAALATGGAFPQSPPYANRFTNGPTAVERMAQNLDVGLMPSGAGGTNYAVGGATTGTLNFNGLTGWSGVIPNLPSGLIPGSPLAPIVNTGIASQIQGFIGASPAFNASSSLFVVWGGPNDFFLGQPAQAIANLQSDILALASIGARNFLVPNMPDLSITPAASILSPLQRAMLQQGSIAFNLGLAQLLTALDASPLLDITQFDTFSLLNEVVANPGNYGFTDANAPCVFPIGNSQFSVCSDPDQHVFWDGVHPTAAAHGILGGRFAAAVPEPGTLLQLALGLALLFVFSRRRAAARALGKHERRAGDQRSRSLARIAFCLPHPAAESSGVLLGGRRRSDTN